MRIRIMMIFGDFQDWFPACAGMAVRRRVRHAGFKEESKVDARAGIIPDFNNLP